MPTDMELRHAEKRHLFQLLLAQHDSKTPEDFKKLIAQMKAEMEADDVKAVVKDFEDWKNSL